VGWVRVGGCCSVCYFWVEGWLVDWAGLEEEGGSVCRGGDDGDGYLDNVAMMRRRWGMGRFWYRDL
jgi:hypothetical protein